MSMVRCECEDAEGSGLTVAWRLETGDLRVLCIMAACPNTIEKSVLESLSDMVVPPEGGVPGNDSKTIQQCFNSRAVLPISKGVLDHAGRNHTLTDAPGGEFIFLKCALSAHRKGRCSRAPTRTWSRSPT